MTAEIAIKELLENPHFLTKVEKCISRLAIVDSCILQEYDIPELLLTIVEFTSRHQVSLNRLPLTELETAWTDLIMEVLERFSAIPDEEEDTFIFVVKGCVKLLLVHPDTVPSRKRTFWQNGFNWNIWTRNRCRVSPCCGLF